MAIILTILLFGVIIVFHELGHFLTAKLNKIKVNAFSIGFGPPIFSWNRGQTKYSIRIFPYTTSFIVSYSSLKVRIKSSYFVLKSFYG